MPQLGDISEGIDIGQDTAHKIIFHACELCGKERWVRLGRFKQGKSRVCPQCRQKYYREQYEQAYNKTVRLRGDKSYNWRGGRSKCLGYNLIWVDPKDFFAPMRTKVGYVREHRLIMAKHLNRCLLPREIVHHKNGVRDDNKIENLEIINGNSNHSAFSLLQKENKRLQRKIIELEKLIASRYS